MFAGSSAFPIPEESGRSLLSSLGWHVSPSEDLELEGRHLRSDRAALARHAQSGGSFTLRAARGAWAHPTVLLICMAGEVTVEVSGTLYTVKSGDLLHYPWSQATLASVPADGAELTHFVGEAWGKLGDDYIKHARADARLLGIFSATTESVLAADLNASSAGLPIVWHSIELMAIGLVGHSNNISRNPNSTAATQLRARAIAEIHRSLPSADLNVDTLANTLGVSRAHLFRVFRELGSTPSRAIREARLARAHTLIEQGELEASIAPAVGFRDAQTLRKWLDRMSPEAAQSTTPAPTASTDVS